MRKWIRSLPHGQLITSAAYLVVAFGLGIGTVVYTGTSQTQRVVYEDVVEGEDSVVSIEENEVPLANPPKVTKSKKTNTKKVKMKKKAKKTSKKKKTSETSDKKTKKSGGKTIVTETDVKTTVETKTKKNSNVKTIKTTVLTTVTTTESTKAQDSAKASAYEFEVTSFADIAKTVDADVYKAFNDLGFTYVIDSSLSTSGVFSVKNRWIKTKAGKSTHLLHELGHFVSALEGDAASTDEWKNIYNAEKGLYSGTNGTYVTSTASEYFAESFREYSEDAATLSSSRPQTYNYINNVVNGISVDEDVKAFYEDYGWSWES